MIAFAIEHPEGGRGPDAEKGVAQAPWQRPSIGLLAGVLSRQGQELRARELMAALDPDSEGVSAAFTMFHALRDEREEAAVWFERAIDERLQFVPMILLTRPYLPRLRASSRWPALARRLHLSETS